jgi:hypothetical protein
MTETFNFTVSAPSSVTVEGGPGAFRHLIFVGSETHANNSLGVYEIEYHDASGKISTAGATISGAGRNTSHGDYPDVFDGNAGAPRFQSNALGPTVSPPLEIYVDFGAGNEQSPSKIKISPRNGDANAPYSFKVYGSNTSAMADRVLLGEFTGLSSGWSNGVLRSFDLDGGGETGNVLDAVEVTAVEGDAAKVGQPVAGADGEMTINADGSYVYAPYSSGGGTPPPAPVLTESLVSDQYVYAFANGLIQVGGQTYIVSPDAGSTAAGAMLGKVHLQKKDGTRNTIASGGGWFERLAVVDMNGNGRDDILIVENDLGRVGWLENPGHVTAPWTHHIIGSEAFAYNVAAADLGGVGFIDSVALTSWETETVVLFTWDGNAWNKQTLASGLGKTRFIAFADMDGDGQREIIAGGESDLVMLKWNGTAWALSTLATIGTLKNGIVEGSTAWVAGAAGVYSVTTSGAHLEIPLANAYDVARGDLYGDGNIWTVATSRPNGGVFLIAPDGTMTTLKVWDAVNQPTMGDADGDGDMDIIGTADGSVREMRIWEQS